MEYFHGYQYVLIFLIFVWSGFVRSGLGFGGAALSLPFLLLVDNQPLVYLPIIAIQLLFFSSLTMISSHRRVRHQLADGQNSSGTIDWRYLKYAIAIMIVPKLVGVFGLVVLPNDLMSAVIFIIVGFYACSYLFGFSFSNNSRWGGIVLLILGGYMSGTSLIGAPLIIAVVANQVSREQLRDTLFAIWFILVSIKLSAFLYFNIDLQLRHQLWLLPAAGIGHYLGLKVHEYLLKSSSRRFYRVMGGVLLFVSLTGFFRNVWAWV
ncbi:sulfite exporter TauE/SafE family protein [Gynuella sp.]|uniref:sulfite exporter TauE/SafE family protein n=1 Tax=Gynuella sp. TaxID=2969146 RepID=UPI003D134470